MRNFVLGFLLGAAAAAYVASVELAIFLLVAFLLVAIFTEDLDAADRRKRREEWQKILDRHH